MSLRRYTFHPVILSVSASGLGIKKIQTNVRLVWIVCYTGAVISL